MSIGKSIAVCFLVALGCAFGTDARADDKPKHRDKPQDVEIDQNEALERLKRHDAKPLADAIAAARAAVAGDIVRVKVKRVKDRLAYEFKMITTSGLVREVYVDTATLEILKTE